MGLTPREILYVVELIYYVPALLLALYVIKKHGHGRQLGWFYLVILALLRLIGSSTGIAAIYHPTHGLVECSLITFSVGLSPLLLALLGILKRLSDGMKGHGIPVNVSRVAHLPLLVGLVLAIIGGTEESGTNSSSSDGYTFTKAGILLFLLGYLILVAMTFVTFTKQRHILEGERRLLLAALISLPFLLVRLLYSLIVAFDHTSTVFSLVSTTKTAVIVQSIMSVLMEFIVVAIYLAAGLLVRVIPRSMVKEGYVDPPSYNASGPQGQYTGVAAPGQQSGPYQGKTTV